MRHLKRYFFIVIFFFAAMSSFAVQKDIDMKEILWGHIKDSYEWHVTNLGETPVVIHLPVIVKSSTGWHVFCSSQFEENPDSEGNRRGPYGLYIKGSEDETYPNKIVEKVGNTEVRPLDISITKTTCVLFIDAFIFFQY